MSQPSQPTPQPRPTTPWSNPPQVPPRGPSYFTADPITVPDLPCGHLPGDVHNDECAYWIGVAAGDYPAPDAYVVTDAVTIPPHLLGLLPLTDPALRDAA
ncbi:hypothetical protein [Micromonospora sp. NPDC023633]|uniref:hypothetical protein n=1 Tax=Micromonospora sp. NPDC023633 TaxID=3154320 RepID=UPI0034038C51